MPGSSQARRLLEKPVTKSIVQKFFDFGITTSPAESLSISQTAELYHRPVSVCVTNACMKDKLHHPRHNRATHASQTDTPDTQTPPTASAALCELPFQTSPSLSIPLPQLRKPHLAPLDKDPTRTPLQPISPRQIHNIHPIVTKHILATIYQTLTQPLHTLLN